MLKYSLLYIRLNTLKQNLITKTNFTIYYNASIYFLWFVKQINLKLKEIMTT